MIIVSAPKNELQDAGKIANSLNLLDIRLRAVNVFEEKIEAFFNEKDTNAPHMDIDYKSEKKDLIEGQVMTALVGANVTLVKGAAKVSFAVQYLVTYGLPTVAIPSDIKIEMFDSFARHNGLLNCWPYIRTLISSLSTDVGVPIMLPLLKIQAKQDDVAKEAPKS